MKKFNILLAMLMLLAVTSVDAQRYLKPTFSSVKVTRAAYGQNFTVLLVPSTGKMYKQPLGMDVYTPVGDTETKRPLMIYLHTGNFLPTPQNNSPSGTFYDSTAVEICTRYAKMGYVVASADYRTGWNPVDTVQEKRISGLINAAYRGVQDARTCVRFFKEKGAAFGVDTTKIMMIGQGTGGYITLACASLDKYSEIITTTAPAKKFIGSSGLPYVIEKTQIGMTTPPTLFYINSDVEGKNLGLVPPQAQPTIPKALDTLCLPNWVNHTSDINFAVNIGGAVGDISWIDAKTPPIVSFQCPYDPFAPYKDAVLFVPVTPPLPVVQVQGSYEVSKKLNALGTNDIFKKIKKEDPYAATANKRNDGYEGLCPLYGNSVYDSSPWDFWATTNPNAANGLKTNPNMSKAKAGGYIDTIVGYSAPRACIALKLPCANIVATDDLTDADVSLTVAPNPATTTIRFTADAKSTIKELYIYDINGRVVRLEANINSNEYTLNRQSLTAGMYFVQLRFENGFLTKRVIFE